MTDRLKNKISFHRSRLADLYEEINSLPAGTAGAIATKLAVSDAIDRLDQAYRTCPTQETK